MSDDIRHYDGLCEDTKRKAEKRVEWRMLSLQRKDCSWTKRYDLLVDSLLGAKRLYRPYLPLIQLYSNSKIRKS